MVLKCRPLKWLAGGQLAPLFQISESRVSSFQIRLAAGWAPDDRVRAGSLFGPRP